VGAVCLYIACRVGKSFHLLIDFQDAIQVNVFKLGSIFLELNQKFYLNLPQIDPSLYINRFCSRLEFDTKKNQVVNSALRILQSMNRAWL
jgi:transcription factor IIIB 90 kDa subunit